MKHLRHVISAVSLALAASASAAPARITASIDSAVVEMGAFATVTLDVVDNSHSGHVVDLPESGTDAEAFDFTTVTADTTAAGYVYTLRLQAWYPGVLTMPPFRYAVGADTVESDIVTLKILPVEMDSTQTLNPMESVVNPPRKWYDYIPEWTLWALLGLVFVALVVAGVLLYLNYRRTGTILVHKPKPVDPYAEAMEALSRLRQERLAESGKEKEFYTRLIDILRRYLQVRFGINAMEMSSSQILASLRRNPETKDNQARIKQILDLADIVKFAKVRPMPDDNIKSFNTVTEFVESTKPVPAEPEQADGASKSTPQKKK